ncbi:MAG TPA: Ku protein, partial [Patescibacteria group bacterium]|nr:Ku protein [Patescibacteria group bacterium]
MRAIWTGSLSFGLINIPVKMYSGEERGSNLEFDMLDKKTMSRIRYARIGTKTGKEVSWNNIVKGYKCKDGDYIILTDEDFKKANRHRRQTIDIKAFVKSEEIDERFYEKPYYLEPQKGAENAYALLTESLHRSNKVAVAKFVLRNRDHLASVKAVGRALVLFELRFQSEVREFGGLSLPDKKAASDEQVKMALALVDQLTKHFIPEDYHDTYKEELEKLIDKK